MPLNLYYPHFDAAPSPFSQLVGNFFNQLQRNKQMQAQDLANKQSETNLKTLAQLNQERLKNVRQLNAMNAIKQQFIQPQAEAELALTQAKTRAEGVPTMSNLGKAFFERQKIIDQYGADSPQAKAYEGYIDRLSKGQQGMNIAINPQTGEIEASLGGTQVTGAPGDAVAMPGYGSKTGGGKLFVDPKTGNYVVTPTTPVLTSLQQQQMAAEFAKPFIEQVAEGGKFQKGTTQLAEKMQGFSNKWLGTEFGLPSELAHIKSVREAAADHLAKVLYPGAGSQLTDAKKEAVINIVTPRQGETEKSYRNRITTDLTKWINEQATESKYLQRRGFTGNMKSEEMERHLDASKLNNIKIGDKEYSIEDIEHTAKLRNMSTDEVIAQLEKRSRSE